MNCFVVTKTRTPKHTHAHSYQNTHAQFVLMVHSAGQDCVLGDKSELLGGWGLEYLGAQFEQKIMCVFFLEINNTRDTQFDLVGL